MKIKEVIERNFKLDPNGKVIDDAGNEYRNEHGRVEYIEIPTTFKVGIYWTIDDDGHILIDTDSITQEFERKLNDLTSLVE